MDPVQKKNFIHLMFNRSLIDSNYYYEYRVLLIVQWTLNNMNTLNMKFKNTILISELSQKLCL